ncbi:MAG: bacteriorhodopsin [Halobaculum sp.]
MVDVTSLVYGLGATSFLVGIFIVYRLTQTEEGRAGRGAFPVLYTIPVVAGLSYVGMALGLLDVQVGTVEIPALRYVDWLITTPVLVGYAAYTANAPRKTVYAIAGVDAAMILIGYLAVVTTGTLRILGFAFSSLCYVGLLWALYRLLPAYAHEESIPRRRLFEILKNHVGLLWLAYPLIWAVGPLGIDAISITAVALLIAFMDVIAKVPYTYFVYAHRDAFDPEAAGTSVVETDDEQSGFPAD